MLRLHEAEDGHLARLRLPGGRIDAEQLAVVADVAGTGNGLVELTSRANLQIRGLGPDPQPVADVLHAAGLLPSPDHERARNIAASPFAGRLSDSVAPVDGIVAAIDGGLCADPVLTGLPGRFMFAVDDGSGHAPIARAGVALAPTAQASACGSGLLLMRLWLGGLPTDAVVPASEAAGLALDAARAFLALRAGREGVWTVHDLAGGPRPLAGAMGAALLDAPAAPGVPGRLEQRDGRIAPATPAPAVPGRLEQRDGRVALTAMAPLGRIVGESVRALAELLGPRAGELRLSYNRTVTVPDVAPADAAAVAAALEREGLVLEPRSGWRGITACAGLGACAKAKADVRALAARRALARTGEEPAEHWTACERRCGELPGTPVTASVRSDAFVVTVGGSETVVEDAESALALLESPG